MEIEKPPETHGGARHNRRLPVEKSHVCLRRGAG